MASNPFVPTLHHNKYSFINPVNGPLRNCAEKKTVLVIGGGRGIGKTVAQYFALASTATLIIAARRYDSLQEAKSRIENIAPHCKVLIAVVDISSSKSINALFEKLLSLEGAEVPHVLVNVAGSCRAYKSILKSEPDEWWADSECNIKGTYLCCQAYLKALDGKAGTIMNFSSGASIGGALPGLSAYAVGKTTVNRLTEYIDMEHALQGVRCFAVQPGAVGGTDLAESAPDWMQPYFTDPPDLAAGMCLYLSQPRADYLKGRYVDSQWDIEELESKKDEILEKDLLKTRVAFA